MSYVENSEIPITRTKKYMRYLSQESVFNMHKAARTREITPARLREKILEIVLSDPTLIDNVLDDLE